MKAFNIFFFFLSISCILHAQEQTNVWYFGEYAGLDFNSGKPVPLMNSAMKQLEGSASISDSDGNLLFYTNGVEVWDASHHIMPNGSGLTGNYSTSQTIIIPRPQYTGRYFIFYCDKEGGPNGLRYSEIDMSLNGGLGDIITETKNTILHRSASEKLTAVNHCDNSSVWLMSTNYATDEFYAYLISEKGISAPVKSATKADDGRCCNTMKFSPDGKWLANTNTLSNGDGDDAQLYRFDNKNGILTFFCLIPHNEQTKEAFYGISFSPDNTRLYLASFFNVDYSAGPFNTLYQYNLTVKNIAGSKKVIYSKSYPDAGLIPNPYGALQNAPDGKIYLARWAMSKGMDTLAVIHFPNALGSACRFDPAGLALKGRNSLLGLPNFNESYFNESPGLAASFDVKEECDRYAYSFAGTHAASTYYWDFGDGQVSTEPEPLHVFNEPGTYTIRLTINYDACVTATSTYELEVKDYSADLFIPNVITPNGDGKNEIFEIGGLKPCREYSLEIYNKYGGIVVTETGSNPAWDGTRSGSVLPDGTYYFVLLGNGQKVLGGSFMLIR